jgi:hypothetical protein
LKKLVSDPEFSALRKLLSDPASARTLTPEELDKASAFDNALYELIGNRDFLSLFHTVRGKEDVEAYTKERMQAVPELYEYVEMKRDWLRNIWTHPAAELKLLNSLKPSQAASFSRLLWNYANSARENSFYYTDDKFFEKADGKNSTNYFTNVSGSYSDEVSFIVGQRPEFKEMLRLIADPKKVTFQSQTPGKPQYSERGLPSDPDAVIDPTASPVDAYLPAEQGVAGSKAGISNEEKAPLTVNPLLMGNMIVAGYFFEPKLDHRITPALAKAYVRAGFENSPKFSFDFSQVDVSDKTPINLQRYSFPGRSAIYKAQNGGTTTVHSVKMDRGAATLYLEYFKEFLRLKASNKVLYEEKQKSFKISYKMTIEEYVQLLDGELRTGGSPLLPDVILPTPGTSPLPKTKL